MLWLAMGEFVSPDHPGGGEVLDVGLTPFLWTGRDLNFKRWGSPLPQGYPRGSRRALSGRRRAARWVKHRLGAHVLADRPAHHAPAPDIEDHCQVDEPAPGGDVGDVGHVRHPEPTSLFLANQAVAFAGMSRSILSWRFSRRSRANSSRSTVVSPSLPGGGLPASQAACAS